MIYTYTNGIVHKNGTKLIHWKQRRGEKRKRGERGREKDSAYTYLDKLSSGGTEPVPVRIEDQSIDDLSSILSIQMLPLIQIP